MFDLEMTNNNPSEEVRPNVLASVLNIYENRVYDPAYQNSLRPRIEGDMSHLLQTSNFEQEVDEHLRGIGIFPTAFEHEENRKAELRRLLAATFYAANGDKPVWIFQDVHLHGLAASAQIAPGDTLVEINGQPVAPPVKPTVLAHGVSRITVETRKGTKSLEVNPELLNARPANGLKYWLLHHDPHTYAHSSILPGGIGYVRVAEFPGLIGVHVAHQIDKAFARVSRREHLIVDIRGNPGGGTSNLRLMTHLTPERIPVGYSLTRSRAASGYRREDLPQFARIPSSRLLLPFAVWKFRKLD
jgi:C-terminal processing protease CtpA/Prc